MLNKLLVARLIIAEASKKRLMRTPYTQKEFITAVLSRGKDSTITPAEVAEVMGMSIKDLTEAV